MDTTPVVPVLLPGQKSPAGEAVHRFAYVRLGQSPQLHNVPRGVIAWIVGQKEQDVDFIPGEAVGLLYGLQGRGIPALAQLD